MFKKMIGLAAVAGTIVVGSGIGCTLDPVGPSADDASVPTDAAVPPRDVNVPDRTNPTIACYSADDAITGFKYTNPVPSQGACSPAQIDNILASCFGTGGDATKCKAATDAAPLCDDCITGKADGPFPAFVTIDDQGQGLIGIPNCAGLVLNKPDCGPKILTAISCLSSACASCDPSGEEACETDATAGACKDALAAATLCNTDLNAGKATTDPICLGTTPTESLKKVATYLCGGTASDAGGGG